MRMRQIRLVVDPDYDTTNRDALCARLSFLRDVRYYRRGRYTELLLDTEAEFVAIESHVELSGGRIRVQTTTAATMTTARAIPGVYSAVAITAAVAAAVGHRRGGRRRRGRGRGGSGGLVVVVRETTGGSGNGQDRRGLIQAHTVHEPLGQQLNVPSKGLIRKNRLNNVQIRTKELISERKHKYKHHSETKVSEYTLQHDPK